MGVGGTVVVGVAVIVGDIGVRVAVGVWVAVGVAVGVAGPGELYSKAPISQTPLRAKTR